MSTDHEEGPEEYGPETTEPRYFDRLSDDLGLTTVAFEDLDEPPFDPEYDSPAGETLVDEDGEPRDWNTGPSYALGEVCEHELMDDEELHYRFGFPL